MSHSAAPGRSGPRKIRFGYTMLQFLLINLLPLLLIGALWFFGVFDSVQWLPWVLIALLVLMNFWFGATLTADRLVVHNLRRRSIPWSDVQFITAETNLSQRTIVVTENSGRQTRLRCPTTGPFAWDGKFEQKYQALVSWFLAHR